jgi:hypothetical protein
MHCLQTTWVCGYILENFEYSIEQAMNYTSNIIINGDLNVDLLRENNKLLEIITVHVRILKFRIITSYQIISPEAKFKSYLGFTQISCDVYTRTPPPKTITRNGALLDPILVSNLDIVIDSEVISVNRDISDHDATLINIQIPCLLKRSYMRKIPSKLVRIKNLATKILNIITCVVRNFFSERNIKP